MRRIVIAGVLAAVGCAHNVSQDKATGPDGRVNGAKRMVLENGEARTSGIVTYPGGDRVDWKMMEIPADKRGGLHLTLQWQAPRPGLQLAFDVFDEWNTRVAISKDVDSGRTVRTKIGKIDNAKGKYFIRVYAPTRGDAGKYRLTAELKPSELPLFDPLKLEVPDPPKLAAVPDAMLPCDEFQFDPKNPACRSVCPNPPDLNLASCQATMPCPNPPDRRVKACTKDNWPPCDMKAPDPQNPNCGGPLTVRVIKNDVQGGELIITIGGGSGVGIQKDWHAVILRGDSDRPLSGGEVTVVRVDKTFTVGKVKLTTDQIKENPRVRLSPP